MKPRDTINFTGHPGTRYQFFLYYSNTTISNWVTWTANITTAPDPPTSMEIDVKSGKKVVIRWKPPTEGNYSNFRVSVIPLSDPSENIRNTSSLEMKRTLHDLTPGATYEVQLSTVYDNKESQAHISTKFTTKPNIPGKFVVWFRNETSLLVLWEPPYPHGYFTDYKVSIEPKDANVSEKFLPKDDGSMFPSQVAFNDLIPGRAYNISVRTISQDQLSDPTTAQYRTMPLKPINIMINPADISTDSFIVQWDGPDQSREWKVSEFDGYQVAIKVRRKTHRVEKGSPRVVKFKRNILPGRTYEVIVKTISGSVASLPVEKNVTTRPYPVRNLTMEEDKETGELVLSWHPNQGSLQDSYKVNFILVD